MHHNLRVMKKIKSERERAYVLVLSVGWHVYLPVQEVFSEKVTFAKRLE